MFDDTSPIYRQIADEIRQDIVTGVLAADAQVMSTNQYAAFHRINPATAAKGLNELVADGVLYKRRGVGMFVATGAREQLLKRRRSEFADQYVRPLMTEAEKLGITARELAAMIDDWEGRR